MSSHATPGSGRYLPPGDIGVRHVSYASDPSATPRSEVDSTGHGLDNGLPPADSILFYGPVTSAPQGSEREDNQNLHTLSSSHAGPSAARANRTVSLPSVTNDDASNPVIHSLSDYAHVRDYYDFYDPSLGHYLRYNLYIQPPSTDERQRSLVVKKFNNSDMNAILVWNMNDNRTLVVIISSTFVSWNASGWEEVGGESGPAHDFMALQWPRAEADTATPPEPMQWLRISEESVALPQQGSDVHVQIDALGPSITQINVRSPNVVFRYRTRGYYRVSGPQDRILN